MFRFKKEIHPFFLVLKDSTKEKDFLKWSFSAELQFLKKMIYVGIAATLLFVIPDYVKSGLGREFYLSLLSRCAFSVIVYLVYLAIERIYKPSVFHTFLFILSYVITINTTFVIITMQNHSVVYAMSELIGIIVMYILLKQRFLYSVLSAVPASILFISAHIVFGDMDPSSVQTVIFAFVLANIMGIAYNRDLNYFKRIEFLSLSYQHEINDRLEKEIAQREKFQKEVIEMANTDYLTGLYNRRHFVELAEQEIFKCKRYNYFLSILTIDIDYFKSINDKYGHSEGDSALINIAHILKLITRKTDILARIGGEEFIILAFNTSMPDTLKLAENLRTAVEENLFGKNKDIHFTVSIGVASYQQGDTLTDLMQRSDQALYRAKDSGRNKVFSK